MRVAVVGAGAAGLCAVKTLLIDEGFSVVCFEKHSTLGGLWVFDERQEDDNGLPVTSIMYRGLKTNIPKQIMEFPGYPFPDQCDSFIGHEDVLQYLSAYAKEFDLERAIKYEHMVKSISPADESSSSKWTFEVRDLRRGVDFQEEFDSVFVCSGHHLEPNIPPIPGFEDFQGVKMHFYEFHDPSQLKDVRRLAVVGSGPSSWELCGELFEHFDEIYWFAKDKSISGFAKPGPNVTRFVSNPIQRFTRNGVQLESGEEVQVDGIALCTGYLFSFPFLTPECGIRVENARFSPLYKHCVNIEHPTMFLISFFTSFYLPNVTSHYQVKFCANILKPKNEFRLPDKAAMLEDSEKEMEKRTAVGWPPHYYHSLGSFQFEYCDELAAMAGEKRCSEVIRKLSLTAAQWRGTDLVGFRKRRFRILNEDEFEDVTGVGLEPNLQVDCSSVNFRL